MTIDAIVHFYFLAGVLPCFVLLFEKFFITFKEESFLESIIFLDSVQHVILNFFVHEKLIDLNYYLNHKNALIYNFEVKVWKWDKIINVIKSQENAYVYWKLILLWLLSYLSSLINESSMWFLFLVRPHGVVEIVLSMIFLTHVM